MNAHISLWKCVDGTYDVVSDGEVIRENIPVEVLAAAPDLLASADAFLTWFQRFVGDDTFIEIKCAELDALNATINKAKGE